MSGRAPEVQEPSLGEHDDRVLGPAVRGRKHPLVDLRLHVHPRHAGHLGEAGHVDLRVEVADVADDRVVLHPRHVLDADDVLVTGRGDEEVGSLDHVLDRGHLVALHRRLQRADRIDLGDDDTRALAAQRLRAALADVAVPADDGDLPREHHVGRATDSVDE